MKLLHGLTALLLPEKCVLCGKPLNGGMDLCGACRVETKTWPQEKLKLQFLDSFAAVWYYEGYVRASILRYKFHNRRSYAGAYGRILAMRLMELYPDGFDLLTWVPISTRRKLSRGYDQVELLARAVGRELGMKPARLLKKVRHNPPQSGLSDYAARRANVLGAYRMVSGVDVQGKRILLLDDVITTGATAGECARVLLTAGAGEVHCGAMAKTRNKQ